MPHNFDEVFDNLDLDSKKHSTEYHAADVIPMWIADTDFRCPQAVTEAIISRARIGRFGYTVASRRLQEAVAGWMAKRFGWEADPSWVEFCPGVMAGITAACRALLHPGDNIVIQTPCYTPFTAMARNNGWNLLRNEMKNDGGSWSLDYRDLENKLSQPRTKLFILCNPQNPTGYVFAKDELMEIACLCRKYGVFIISDEIHCDYIYTGNRHNPVAALDGELAQRCITFINPSKTFNVAGLHTAAFICPNPELKSSVHQQLLAQKNCSENVFGTVALCTAYESCGDYADDLIAYVEKNMHTAVRLLSEIRGLKIIPPEGTYLLWIDCREWKLTQEELMEFFVDRAKVGVSSGTDYGPEGEGYVRMNIGCTMSTLLEAVRRIRSAAEKSGFMSGK